MSKGKGETHSREENDHPRNKIKISIHHDSLN